MRQELNRERNRGNKIHLADARVKHIESTKVTAELKSSVSFINKFSWSIRGKELNSMHVTMLQDALSFSQHSEYGSFDSSFDLLYFYQSFHSF